MLRLPGRVGVQRLHLPLSSFSLLPVRWECDLIMSKVTAELPEGHSGHKCRAEFSAGSV